MRRNISKRWLAALKVTAFTLVILACQLPSLITQQVGNPTNGIEPTGIVTIPDGNSLPSSKSTAVAPGGPTPEITPAGVVFGPGSFDLLDPKVGLANLSSYKATLTLSFNGTQAGQPSQWVHKYVMLASQDNTAHQITVQSEGGALPPFFKVEMNGVSYEVTEKGDCIGSTVEAGTSLTAEWEPAGFLSALIGAEAAGSETVNGVASDKYTFDERALGEPSFTQSTGQVWVASENGVMVRYLLTTKAGADYFGEGIDGVLTTEYDLTDVNQPVTIDLPAGCPGGLVEAPLMTIAISINRQPGLTIYSTPGTIPDVFAFYQAQLSVLGWTSTSEPEISDEMGWVAYVNGDQQLSVIVLPTANGVEVRLVMGPAPGPDPNP
jgi:hypothetical protein